MGSKLHFAKSIALLLLLTLLYVGCARLGLLFATAHKQASPVWPVTGLAIAACSLFGLRVWPAVFVGAALANYDNGTALPTSLIIGVGNTLEAVVGALLLRQFSQYRSLFGSQTEPIAIICAALFATMCSARNARQILQKGMLVLGGASCYVAISLKLRRRDAAQSLPHI